MNPSQNTSTAYPEINSLRVNGVATILFIIICIIGGLAGLGVITVSQIGAVVIWIVTFVIAYYFAASIKIAAQWEKVVVLRLGRFHALRGPGIFFIVPVFDTIAYWIDLRTITSSFKAEQTLTRDNVPVDVDAILFWKVNDARKAALEVVNYTAAVSLAAQTALRDTIGNTELSLMLSGRRVIDEDLKKVIDERTEPWGVSVTSVEIRDVSIPTGLQNAMSQQAQAERERQARVILGDSEQQIAQKFVAAAEIYENNPTALHLRAMNMLYEGLKEKGALIIVPSTALETMNLGTVTGLASYSKEINNTKGV